MLDSQKIIFLIKEFFENLDGDKYPEILGVNIVGSLARGDFAVGISDIDLLVVFRTGTSVELGEETVHRLEQELKKLPINNELSERDHFIDIGWELWENLSISPIKYFNLFQNDLRDHHLLVFGEDFAFQMQLPEFTEQQAQQRLEKFIQKYHYCGDYQKILCLGAALRCWLWIQGWKNFDKYQIQSFLQKQADFSDLLEFHESYLRGKKQSQKLCERVVKRLSI